MAVQLYDAPFRQLSESERDAWKDAEAAAVSDCLESGMAMDGGLKPLDATMQLVGQARTMRCMVGDNCTPHSRFPAPARFW